MSEPPFDPTAVEAVLFDVYGTLLDLVATRPYRQLRDVVGTAPESFARLVMTEPLALRQTASRLGVALPPALLEELETQLEAELRSIRLFADALPTLGGLRERGYRLGVCSNLALPYVAPARVALEGQVDAAIWSCEVGHLKPDPAMFTAALARLAVVPTRCLMVGDSLMADVHGARAAGLQAVHLQRAKAGPLATLTALLDWLPARNVSRFDPT